MRGGSFRLSRFGSTDGRGWVVERGVEASGALGIGGGWVWGVWVRRVRIYSSPGSEARVAHVWPPCACILVESEPSPASLSPGYASPRPPALCLLNVLADLVGTGALGSI